MRICLALLGLALVAGCAKPAEEPVVSYRPAEPARALVFTPEVARFGPALDLDRGGRGDAAFAGFQSEVVTFNTVRLDDRQRSTRFGDFDRVERRTVSTRVF
ncbi:MAG: hypothetical protein AAF743_06960, partial [Planctomycetota bacterium]